MVNVLRFNVYGFMVYGLGFMVGYGLCCTVRFRFFVYGLLFRVDGLWFMVYGLVFMVWGLRFMV